MSIEAQGVGGAFAKISYLYTGILPIFEYPPPIKETPYWI
jgi:hypothetical protein